MKIFLKIFIILFILILSSCNRKNKTSFIDLSSAFDKWFLTHNPSRSNSQNPHNFYIKNKISDRSYIRESILDLKRFKLELNQIDFKKLKKVDLHKYNSITNEIENHLYDYEIIKYYEKNPFYYIDRAKNNLLNILSDKSLSEDRKFNYILNFLNYFPEFLKKSKKSLIETNIYFNYKIHISIMEINELFDIFMNLEDAEFDWELLNQKIISNKKVLNNYNIWLTEKIPKVSFTIDENERKIYNRFIERIEEKYDNHNSIYSLNLSILHLQNNIFRLSLPIYLQTNDEPIWVDRSDTLEVINYVINEKINGYLPKDIESKMIEFDHKYSLIKSFVDSLGIIDIDDSQSYTFVQDNFLFGLYNKNIELISSFNDPNMNVLLPSDDVYVYSSLYSLFIVNNILPQILYNNASNYKVIFENDNMKFAWGKLLSNILLENGFSAYDKNFELYHNIDLLRDFVDILLKDKIMNNNMDKDDLISLLQEKSFYTNTEAELHINKVRFSNDNNIEKYLNYIYLNNFYDLNCIVNKNTSHNHFIKLLFKNGFIPIHSYNSILN